jgi:diguanylate cyclase (GGDEF)-like protein
MVSRGLAVFDEARRPLRMAGSQSDVTKRKVAEERLFHDAFHDTLTGLANRALFTDRLGRSLWRARRREDYRFAVVFLDLDRVKLINDSLGHVAGDRLLLAIARRIEECLRAGDSAARIGGDEYGVLIDDLGDPADALRVVDRLQRAIHAPLMVGGEEVYTTASIGIAFYTERYERPEEMLRDADTAMDAARAAGGARYQIFDQGMHDRAVARLQIEGALRRAVERGEFRAYYQPVVSLETGRLAGFEALIRWEHPERGIVAPAEFIPVAEETGLIHKIGRWMLREACDRMARWTRESGASEALSMSVNLSGRQLAEPDLVARTVRILEETGLAAGRLSLEITESAVMQDADTASERLSELRALGVGISIDDFGTGYSSLSYLHRLPLTALKIDRTFVWAIGPNTRETQICLGIVALAQNLGLTVTAEGIETEEQRQRLRDLHCEYGQGYLFAKPLPAQEATELLRSGRSW